MLVKMLEEVPDRIELHQNTLGHVKEIIHPSEIATKNDDGIPALHMGIEDAQLREDRNRELRSMLLSVHPCPPLPQIALGGLNLEERVFSSHDFLATAIDRMLVKKDSTFNNNRRIKQHLLITDHFKQLRVIVDAMGSVADTATSCVLAPVTGEESNDTTAAGVVSIVRAPVIETRHTGSSTIPGVLAPLNKLPPTSGNVLETVVEAVAIPAIYAEAAVVTIGIPVPGPSPATLAPAAMEPYGDTLAPVMSKQSAASLLPVGEALVERVEIIPATDKLASEIIPATDKLASEIIPATDKLVKKSENMEKLYDCFTQFSRQHAIVYFEENAAHKIDIRYKPLDYVCRGDHVHRAACSHLRAYRLMRRVEPSSATEFEDLSYADVLFEFAQEIVRNDDEDIPVDTP